jgi:hypothetical protein
LIGASGVSLQLTMRKAAIIVKFIKDFIINLLYLVEQNLNFQNFSILGEIHSIGMPIWYSTNFVINYL